MGKRRIPPSKLREALGSPRGWYARIEVQDTKRKSCICRDGQTRPGCIEKSRQAAEAAGKREE